MEILDQKELKETWDIKDLMEQMEREDKKVIVVANRMIPLTCYDVSVGDKGDNGQRGDSGDRGPRGLMGKMYLHVYCTHSIKSHYIYHLKLKSLVDCCCSLLVILSFQ